MLLELDCLSCLMQQSLAVGRAAAAQDSALQRKVLQAWAEHVAALKDADFQRTAPDVAADLYALVPKLTGCDDPYKEHKKRANARMLDLLPMMREQVEQSPEPLRAALGYAIVGNYLDAGAPHKGDLDSEIRIDPRSHIADDNYREFLQRLGSGTDVLMIGDNCGEIVADTLVVRELQKLGCDVTYAVRGGCVLNDATVFDAEHVGMADLCTICDSGSMAPGAVPRLCTDEFRARFHQASLVVSKGQGNFESLEGLRSGVWFAFKAKCDLITRYLDVPMGASLFVER